MHPDSIDPEQWAAWARERLRVLEPLLAPTGVIIASIDDRAVHHLRAALDQVFGSRQYLGTVVVQTGTTKSRGRWVVPSHSYLLIYAASLESYKASGIRWRDQREGVDELLAAGRAAWMRAEADPMVAQRILRRWFSLLPRRSPIRALNRYTFFLPDGRLARDDNAGAPHPGGRSYDIIHPATGRPVPAPSNGWRYSQVRMRELAASGRIRWAGTHRQSIAILRPLNSAAGKAPASVETVNPTHAARHIEKRLGVRPSGVFPKDHRHVARWIRLVTGGKRDAVVLDPFAGTGTTAEAVMLLNAADGGQRHTIMVEKDAGTINRLLKPRLLNSRETAGDELAGQGDTDIHAD